MELSAQRPVFYAHPLISWVAFESGVLRECNPAWLRYTGLSPEQCAGDGWLFAIHRDDLGIFRSSWSECVSLRESRKIESRLLRHSDQSWRWHELFMQPLPAPETDLFGVGIDIHERKMGEERSRQLNQTAELLGSTLDPDRIYSHLRDLVSGSMVCDSLTVSIYDPQSMQIHCRYAWLEGETIDAAALPPIPLAPEGKGMQSAVIRSGEAMLVNDFEKAAANSVTVYHVGQGGKIDTDNSGAQRTQAAILVPIKLDGNVLGVTRVLSNYRMDVYTLENVRLLEALMSQVAAATRNAELYQRARAEVEVRRKAELQVREKQSEVDLLNVRLLRAMRETHHRVKNNLQVICALIDMQVETGGTLVPVHEFRRLSEHVRSLAALHDLLTDMAKEDADVETLSLSEAVERLVPMLQQIAHGRLAEPDVEEIRIPVRQSPALTILVNELVTNAVKHGMGVVRLACRNVNGKAHLEVSDEGPGFPPGFDAKRASGTGLELVETLARWDLRGETRYENAADGGARAVVLFPIA